jgi:hypothetical protein
MYFTKIKHAIMAEQMDKIRTAPALTSFMYFMLGFRSVVIRSQILSMALLNSSDASTMLQQLITMIHSEGLILKKMPAAVTKIAARKWIFK